MRRSKTLFVFSPNIPATSVALIPFDNASGANKWKFCNYHLDFHRDRKWLWHYRSEKRNTAKYFRSNIKTKKIQLTAQLYFEDKKDRIKRANHHQNTNARISGKVIFEQISPYPFIWNVLNDLIRLSFGTYHTEINLMLILKETMFCQFSHSSFAKNTHWRQELRFWAKVESYFCL